MGITINTGFGLMLQGKESYKDFEGKNLLMLGKQDVKITKGKLESILRNVNFCYKRDVIDLEDCAENYIDSYDLFKCLGFSEVLALDMSDYEGADIIFDLASTCLPEGLQERFDYIYDGGTLEHIFNFPQAINNVSKMLKIGGVIIHVLPCNNWIDHGFYSFSPTVFIDYYNENKFTIDSIFLVGIGREGEDRDSVDVVSTDCRYNDMGQWALRYAPQFEILCLCSVKKRSESTNDKFPRMQGVYARIEETLDKYRLERRIKRVKNEIKEKYNIALYGSGATAGKILQDAEIKEHVIGLYDISLEIGARITINECELPVLSIDNIKEDQVDAILIASEKYDVIDIIRKRIKHLGREVLIL